MRRVPVARSPLAEMTTELGCRIAAEIDMPQRKHDDRGTRNGSSLVITSRRRPNKSEPYILPQPGFQDLGVDVLPRINRRDPLPGSKALWQVHALLRLAIRPGHRCPY